MFAPICLAHQPGRVPPLRFAGRGTGGGVLLILLLFFVADVAWGACQRQCRPGQKRDAHGCCVAAPGSLKARKPRVCPAGKVKSADTRGHCCWPGQAWNKQRCVGVPESCPEGMHPDTKAETCRKAPCLDGRVRAQDGLHCCWPGQGWSGSKDQCIGKPKCPKNTEASGQTCLKPFDADMVPVEAGAFERGADDQGAQQGLGLCRDTYLRADECSLDWFKAEGPRGRTTLDTFSIDKYEVTNAAYSACVGAKGCTAQDLSQCHVFQADGSGWKLGGKPHAALLQSDHPVICITWQQASAYCAWAGKRLPTEAEWEKAARGDKDDRPFPWGRQWQPAALNWAEKGAFGAIDGFETTAPVGAFPRNKSPYGAFDMAGNVWEWTADWYSTSYYAKAPRKDPLNTMATGLRSARGGSWSFAGNGARLTYRFPLKPDTRDDSVGFRCVKAGDATLTAPRVHPTTRFDAALVEARLKAEGWQIKGSERDRQQTFDARIWDAQKGAVTAIVGHFEMSQAKLVSAASNALRTEQGAKTQDRGLTLLSVEIDGDPRAAQALLDALAR